MTLAGSHRLVYVMGPSGAGKDSVLARWLERLGPAAGVHLARRVITRPAQATGEQHEAVDRDTWEALRRDGRLALHWEANGRGYGIRHEALAPLARGQWVVVNGSRALWPQLPGLAPHVHGVLITASRGIRQQRLLARAREPAQEIEARLQRAAWLEAEVAAGMRATDLVLHNDGALDDAVRRLDDWWRVRANSLFARSHVS